MILRSVRRLVEDRPVLTTSLLVGLAMALAVGSLAGVLAAVGDSGSQAAWPPAYGSAEVEGCKTDPAQPKRQFRAMWITTVSNIDWPSRPGLDEATIKDEYVELLDVAVANRFNAVMVMVRVAGDTIWPSKHEPWTGVLTGVLGKDPGWDPMAFAVAEAHKRGLEFHAWYNPYRASTNAPAGAGPDLDRLAEGHPLRKHPEWAVAYPPGTNGRLYYNPGEPDARRFIEDAMLDAVERYDVDGVHFDDFFYPYPAKGEDFPDDATFAKYGEGFSNKAAWRRSNVDLMIKEMHERIHDLKPWVQFGVSPFGIWRNASADPDGSDTAGNSSYTANHADTKRWVEQGWLDYIAPQLYWTRGFEKADYTKLVPWWSKVVEGTSVRLYIGQAAYRAGTDSGKWAEASELSAHLTFNRKYPQVTGDIYFSAKDVRKNRAGAMARLVAEQYASPALVPLAGESTTATRPAPMITKATLTERSGSAGGAAGGNGAAAAGGTGAGGTTATAPASGTASAEADTVASSVAVRLEWKAPVNQRSGATKVASYAVYRLEGAVTPERCAFADATNLIAVVRSRSFVDTRAKAGTQYRYFITAIDRLGRESDLSQPHTVGKT